MLKKPIFIGLCIVSFLDFLATSHSRLDLLSHFKLQFCLIIFMGTLFFALKKSWRLVFFGLCTLSIHLAQIIPWYLPAKHTSSAQQDQTIPELKILLANVYFDNQQTEALHALVLAQQPDLVVLQEANSIQIQMMDRLVTSYPFSLRPPQNNPFGLAVWSKYAIEKNKFLFLAKAELPSLSGDLKVLGQTLHLFTTHLSSPIRKPALYRNRQLEALGKYLKGKQNYLVLGDFNTAMWSPHYKKFAADTGLLNCRKGFGVLPTWPAQIPAWGRIPIDQCFISANLNIQSMAVGPPIGSDHLPVIITLSFN